MRVRRLLPGSDFELWKAIRLEALLDSPAAFGGSHEEESRQKDKDWEYGLKSSHIFACMHGEKPIGIAGYYFSTSSKLRHRAKVFSVYVNRAFRGKGVMDALLNTLIAHAKAQGFEQLHLDVGTYNKPAIACYERHGFAIYAMEPHAIKLEGEYIDEHLMVKYI